MTSKAYPLQWPEGWPRTRGEHRTWSRFKVTPGGALRKLQDEVRIMGGTSLVVSSNARLNRFGLPFEDEAKKALNDPGVAVYFMWRRTPYVMARDVYPTVFENVMGIAHAIAHMRGLSRHGGDHMMQKAFTGFAALPPPANVKPKRPWYDVFGLPPEMADRGVIEAAYKMLVKQRHPDASGGSHEAFIELNEAREEALSHAN